MAYKTQKKAEQAGKCETSAAQGGFVVAKMSWGEFDWFPTGQNPHYFENGKMIRDGEIVSRFYFNPNGRTWKRLAA